MRQTIPSSRWPVLGTLCVAFWLSCGGTDKLSIEDTSVVVEVRNAAGQATPEQVILELYQNDNPLPTRGVTNPVTGATSNKLGELVVFTPADTNMLRVVAWGQIQGVSVSRGEATVSIRSRRQEQVVVTLTMLAEGVDAGPTVTFDDGGVPQVPDAASGGMGGQNNQEGGAGGGSGGGGSGGMAVDAPVEPTVDASSPDVAPPKAGLGEACLIPGDCGSGFCVDRVCCNTSCTGNCVSCKAPGKTQGICEPLARDVRCASPTCNSGGRTLRTHACDGFGVCVQKDTSCTMRMCSVANPDSPTCQ